MLGKRGHSRFAHIAAISTVVLLLRVALDFAYVTYVAYYFSGDFPFPETNALRVAESYAVMLVLATWLNFSLYRRWRPSGIALVLYFVVVILPLSSLYGLVNAPSPFMYAAAGSFAALITVTEVLPKIKMPRPSRDLVYLGMTTVAGISTYVYGWLVLTGGVERLSFDLLSVYEVRSEYIQRLGPFVGYLVPWQANVVNIVIICTALWRRNYWLLGIGAVAQLFLFGMTGHKSFILAPILAGGIYFIWARRDALFYIVGGAAVLVIASDLLFLATGYHLVPSLLIRRLFFVPSLNHLIYFDFFSQPEHPFVMLSNSIFAPFITYPYDEPVTKVIAGAYWGTDFWPNVGYLADAFAHFGFMGMFLFSIVLGLFLRVVDSVGKGLPDNFLAAVVATPAMALTNSALFTSFLTHGLIFTLVMLWLLSRVLEKRTTRRSVRCSVQREMEHYVRHFRLYKRQEDSK